MTEFSWGPCMPSCTLAEYEDSQACGHDDVGVRYCDELPIGGEEEHVWHPCLEAVCVHCEPGETRLCGPNTPYPDTIIPCGLSGGVPIWHDSDCYT